MTPSDSKDGQNVENRLEARAGIEPANNGFADPSGIVLIPAPAIIEVPRASSGSVAGQLEPGEALLIPGNPGHRIEIWAIDGGRFEWRYAPLASTMKTPLVLSLFPGIGLLDRAFEEDGYIIVRGPDQLWGGDIRRFHVPPGKFNGIIGGPPCQAYSIFANLVRAQGRKTAPDLIPEFVRCVEEGQPEWFLMENVPRSSVPQICGYAVSTFLLNNRWLGEKQSRLRRFSFGVRGLAAVDLRTAIQPTALEHPEWFRTVLASGGMRPGTESKRGRLAGKNYGYTSVRTVAHALELQGLPPDFLKHAPFTVHGKQHAIGNGVPLPMGRAIASAIRKVLYAE